MPEFKKRARRGVFSRKFWGSLSIINFLNWLAAVLVILIFATLAMGPAGSDPAQAWSSQLLTGILLIVHGVWLFVRGAGSRHLETILLWALPLLVWMAFEALVLSPYPIAGLVMTATLGQAFVVCWVVAHQIRSVGQIQIVCGGAVAIVVIAALVGLCQYLDFAYLLPQFWSIPSALDGRAAGPFDDPTGLGLLILASVFPLLAFALVPRFSVVSRLFFAYLSVVLLLAFFFTFSIAAAFSLVVGFLILPKSIGTSRRKRFAGWLFSGAFLMAVMLLVSISDALFEVGKRDVLRRDLGSEDVWIAAASVGLNSPVIGTGSGRFVERFEEYRSPSFGFEITSPGSTLATVWAEYGGVGMLFFLVPAIIFPLAAVRLFRSWNWYSREELNRRKKRVQIEKVAVGSCICALFGIVPAVLMVNGFQLPVILVAIAILAGFLFNVGGRGSLLLAQPPPVAARAVSCGCVVLLAIGWIAVFGPAFKSAYTVAEAEKLIRAVRTQPLMLQGENDRLDQARRLIATAASLQPADASVWSHMAWISVLRSYRQPARKEELGLSAIDAANHALMVNGDSYWAWFNLGLGLWLADDSAGAVDALERALQLAPNDFMVNYYLGALYFGLGKVDEARDRVGHAGLLRPTDEAVRRLRQMQAIPGRRWGRAEVAQIALPPPPAPSPVLFQTGEMQ